MKLSRKHLARVKREIEAGIEKKLEAANSRQCRECGDWFVSFDKTSEPETWLCLSCRGKLP